MTQPAFTRCCGTCEHMQPVGDRGECHAAPPTAAGWPRVEHDSRPCERYAADVGPVLVELGEQRRLFAEQRRLNVRLAVRIAAASEVLGRSAERRVIAEEWSDGAGI